MTGMINNKAIARNNNNSSNNSPTNSTPPRRLLHVAIFFGLLLITLQLLNAYNTQSKEDTLDRIRLLGQHGEDGNIGVNGNAQQQQQQQQSNDQMKAEMTQLRKDLEEQTRLNAETTTWLHSLKKQVEELKAEVGKQSQSTVQVQVERKEEQTAETTATQLSNSKYPYAKPPVASEFVKQDSVVIATKIHGTHQLHILKQFLCLFNFAYNNKMKYDILIFSTDPLTPQEEQEIIELGKPANVQIVVDNPGLHQLIDELEPHKRTKFLKKCNLDQNNPQALQNLTWFSDCKENGRSSRLAYNWQAEFRALRIWKNPALKPYRYMLWIDADAFCTEEWKRDPVAFFIEHKLAILFANFGAGISPGGFPEFKSRFMTSFNRTISNVEVVEGHLTSQNGTGPVHQIHGFMHMTDLDFYRSEPVMKWARTLIGDEFLSRRFDDQLAVTAPAVVLAPERSWDMRQNGITLNVFHNGFLDGQEKAETKNFRAYWNDKGGDEKMPGSKETCEITANG